MNEIHVLVTIPFSEAQMARLQAVSPALKFHLVAARSVDDLPETLLEDIEILYTMDVLPDPADLTALRWVQFHLAGIDHAVGHPLLFGELKVTTLSGAAAAYLAEFAMTGIIALAHRLPLLMADKQKKRWAKDRFVRFAPIDLSTSTVGVVGYGSTGREIARLCRAFGATVLASKRDLMQLEDEGYRLEGQGDPEAQLAERLYPPHALGSMAALCDFLVVCVPLTPDTRGLVGEKVLSQMKPSAFLVDISRGGIVDHGALVTALLEGRLAGAALDVFPVEPLPENSPLWDHPNVIISPHIAAASTRYRDQAVELFANNLQRYLAGLPLLNLYNRERGY